MKTEAQHSEERKQLCQLIEDMDVAMLTAIDSDGALVSRPMAPLEMDADGALWFFTDRRSHKSDRLRRVNLAFTDTPRATYVSISGRCEVHVDAERAARLWTPFAKPWFPDGPTSANLALLKVIPEVAEFWDAPNSRMARVFAMVASVVAARPIGIGDHDRLTDLSPLGQKAA